MNRDWFEAGLERPWRAMALWALVAVIAVLGMTRLRFDASYSALLPRDAPMVREFDAVKEQLGGGTSDLIVIVRGPEQAREAFARDLARRLDRDPRIAWTHTGNELERDLEFFRDRAFFLAPIDELRGLEHDIAAAYEQSIAQAMAVVELDDEPDPWQPVRERIDRLGTMARDVYPHGSAAHHVFVRPRVSMTELAKARAIMQSIRAAVAALDPAGAGVDVGYAGRLAIHLAEQQATSEDLSRATLLALMLVVLLMTTATRRLSAPLIIAVPLFLSLCITLAISTVLVEQLNLLSAFTLPALVGLGVDFGIHLYLQFKSFFERTGATRREAMRQAIQATRAAAATSALTTAGAFLALAAVDFRGFREFGLLGSSGVLITFAVTYLVMPPLALIVPMRGPDRVPDQPRSAGLSMLRWRGAAARFLALAMVALALIGAVVAVLGAPRVRFENDFERLKSNSQAARLTESIEAETGLMMSPTVFMVPDMNSARQVERIVRSLPAGGPGDVPIAEVLSAASMIPDDVAVRQAILDRLGQKLGRMLAFGDPAPDTGEILETLISMTRVRPWGVAELPVSLRRRLVAAAGGRLFVYVWPQSRLYRDAEMRRWVHTVAKIRDRADAGAGPDARVKVLDERRMPIQIVDMVGHDLPAVLLLASVMVVAILIGHFRRAIPVILVIGILVLAMAITLGVLALTGIHINIYNAVVLPCLVGMGIDNAVHIHHAYDRGGPGSLAHVFRTTGLAAILASLTTAIGFGATIIARQGGLQTMAVTAVVGVACILAASTGLLPALLLLSESWLGKPARR